MAKIIDQEKNNSHAKNSSIGKLKNKLRTKVPYTKTRINPNVKARLKLKKN